MMRKKKRQKFIALWLIAALLLLGLPGGTQAYWRTKFTYPEQVTQPNELGIGRWLADFMFKEYSEDGSYDRGDLVLYEGDIYYVLNPVKPGHPDHNPGRPNSDLLQVMRYALNSPAYCWFHFYRKGDYVEYKGRYYVWKRLFAHKPNDPLSQIPPDNPDYWEPVPAPPENTWLRYELYFKGDEVLRKGVSYRCLADGVMFAEPGSAEDRWQRLP